MRVDDLAIAARDLRALDLRMMWHELLEGSAQVAAIRAPETQDPELRAIAASLVELLALRTEQEPPTWVRDVAPLDHTLLLVTARTPARRQRLAEESPEPLRKRRLLAPAGYLTMA